MGKKRRSETLEADLQIKIGEQPLSMHIVVDAGKCGPETILPFVQSLSNKTVDIAVSEAIQDGKSISCKKGCGKCCAQLVPVTETEIRKIAKLINEFTSARKKIIMARFNAARSALDQAGIWESLINPQMLDLHHTTEFGLKYFELEIPCPFLDDGACSIHPQRPLACREYLVTSPAEFCETPRLEQIDGVNIPVRISGALGVLLEDDSSYRSRWVPLIVAPFWNEYFPTLPSIKTGPEWIELFLAKLSESSREEMS